ncbi:undecaprenyldiphospho-muramoylpentapeptide beta-N-acetylglucosaminyltransferase [Aestuariispira insulae]|uniref:UDP-N-acetylglucosamine--N-acetylmuramyl-(pentapeptide) pyrophosphoryl-undecaprenol N-acetylglucosamine transferase n=1 Tax=Aestuariispira insulae TaxID=1461337 RepID=A0A3D9HX90_9PROT|nr:undecaprenyldiphospho-muramoylpentapeptide beta-N-acetylglucosaminyltransferase [Aestuariispira insulae]RED54114.1 UDP-N-acetylglucosamine-N-acetylmuramylpentapeptide N-acetylglucosamine transferase [Aestuariispira insulae]
MSKLIALATGGTGGHVFPAQALAEEMQGRGHRLILITDTRGGAYQGPLGNLETHIISAAGVSGRGKLGIVKSIAKLGIGFFQARKLLKQLRPDAVVGFGGYPSVPTMYAATLLGQRTVIHEQNAVLGRANRLLAPRVDRIATSFEYTSALRGADQSKTIWTGNPIRPEIAGIEKTPYLRPEQDQPIHILVTGGSQGAAIFGETIPLAVGSLPPELRSRIRITQQVRQEQLDEVTQRYRDLGIQADLKSFLDDMPDQLAKSHLVICRAGASTMAELTTAGRPAILVPYPYAVDDHQAANAARLCDAAGAWMIPQADLTVETLSNRLNQLLGTPHTLANAAQAAKRLAMPDATRQLADLVESLLKSNGHGPDSHDSNKVKEAA